MVSIVVLYTRPGDEDAFFRHYEDVHAPLVKKLPGLLAFDLHRLRGNPAPGAPDYVLMAEMRFADRDAYKTAMRSEENAALVADVGSFADGLTTILVGDVTEVV